MGLLLRVYEQERYKFWRLC